MTRTELKRLTRFRAGLILESVAGEWEPDDLLERYGRDAVERMRTEMYAIARRLTGPTVEETR